MNLAIFNNKKTFFIALFLLTIFLRFSSLIHTFLDIDEAQFAGFAHTIMNGGLPYADSLDTKPPFIYLYFLLGFVIFGKYSMIGLHFMHILVSYITSLVLYKIGKETKNEIAGLWASLLFTIFSTTYMPKFISISITSVMVLPLCLSVLFWIKQKPRFYFFSGIMVSFAFLFKYQGGIQIAVFFILGLFDFFNHKKNIKKTCFDFFIFFMGFLAPILLTSSSLLYLGVWNDFVQWSFKGSVHYIDSGFKTVSFFSNLFFKGGTFVLSSFLVWLLFFFYIKQKNQPQKRLITIWFLLSLIPVCIGGRFYGHYFIQLLPSLALGSAFVLAEPQKILSSRIIFSLLIIPAIIFWIPRINQNYTYRLIHDDELEKEEKVGLFLKDKPGKTIFVWGFATAIYFHSHKKPSSRFLWTDLQTGRIPGSDKSEELSFDTSNFARKEAWNALMSDLEKNPPAYFVDTAPGDIHKYSKYPIVMYPRLLVFLMKHYEFFWTIEKTVIYKLKTI